MPGPLHGYRIVDLTSMISGPSATMLLADQGAEVIKVENPRAGGDHTRLGANRRGGFSASFLNNNRGKRSVALDLKDPAAVEALLRVAAGADVFVQNFRPGVAERMGLGEAAVRAAAPDIVYVSISGFGEAGPYAQKPVYDPLVQALSGLATVQAGSDEAPPRLVRTILPDKLTGTVAAQAITAALLARARGAPGQHVRLSMLDAVVAFLWGSDMGSQTFVEEAIPQQEAASFIDLIYATATGHISVAVQSDKEWEALARALERPEWLADPRFAHPGAAAEAHRRAPRHDAGGAARARRRGMAGAADRARRALRPGADAHAAAVAPAGPGQRHRRGGRPSRRRAAAPGPPGGPLLGNAGGAGPPRARARRRHAGGAGRGRAVRGGHRGPGAGTGGGMIDFHYWPTPNGWKVSIMLEECGLPYRVVPVDIGAGDQFKPDFLAISPNNRMPAIVDHGAPGGPLPVFESGSILVHLAERSGRFMPTANPGRKECLEWLFWQVGNLGPMAGQLSHFVNYAEGEHAYSRTRYANEYHRCLGVLERRLEGRDYILDDYSIADMASWPWVLIAKPLGQGLEEFPNVAAWRNRIKARPAVRAGVDLGKEWRRRAPPTPEERAVLFNQTGRLPGR